MKEEIEVPPDHPRAESLRIREMLVMHYRLGIVVPQGLIAHGRGEAFDYLLGEKTIEPALRAIRAAGVAMLLAKHPVISMNGNSTALSAKEVVELAKLTGSKIEVNLFYRSFEREMAIKKALINAGAKEVLGVGEMSSARIPELSSERRKVDVEGIYSADVVLVPLEDGDRTEALRKMGKSVIAIDLNPLSRTARHASITIVDNIIRVIPLLIKEVQRLRLKSKRELWRMIRRFDNEKNLIECNRFIAKRLMEITERNEIYPEALERSPDV
ncbi:MAG: phosphopantothenate/pantothenate synthetase [archaeon]|nr:phosphopantothenate/pantothenate synthetase [archaeon]MCP8306823.1 phosphopantothenate/pantothenate synthetase [archaeon]